MMIGFASHCIGGRLLVAACWLCFVASAPVSCLAEQPNIVLVMVDDMGFSDVGCYGGEIETPHLDELATHGVRFTQFYNTGRCCPTRASLLTGLYQHQAGVGHMTRDLGHPSYRGYLNDRCVTIAECLRQVGYFTAMSGKWHVGSEPKHWPRQRGFDRFYGIPEGGGHHYRTLPGRRLVVDDTPIEVPVGWYSTDAFTDYAVRFIGEGVSTGKPFFLYLAYTAPHWPLQAPEEVTERFLDRYRAGWQPHRDARFERQRMLGLFPESAQLAPVALETPDWSTVGKQAEMARRMAIHAAMVHLVDEGVGRVVSQLRELGVLENTLVLFLTDNGASAEGGATGFVRADRGDPNAITGTPASYVSFGTAGANLCVTPFRKYKSFVHEGGIATPLIAHWPAGIPAELDGKLIHQVGHVVDLLPTCLDLAEATYPVQFASKQITPVAGRSLRHVLQGDGIGDRELYFEHQGNAAVRSGRWKLVRTRAQPWELYDLNLDRTELDDLAHPDSLLLKSLVDKWDAWAEKVGVLPWPPQSD